ncbi:MAG TPA: dihydroorotase [Chromatiales bacterium]|nr:dihydroorotase [Chromatiaceae bacterium]HIN82409.1 dihydroorotase [Chromatiales bacterium]
MHIELTQPDDWHLHLRDGESMAAVVGHTASQFGRAIVMPNLAPPITDVAQALAYRQRILAALPDGSEFNPLMTLYLTDHTSTKELRKAAECEHVHGVKLYPAGATTHSDSGVTSIEKIEAALETLAEVGLPLLVHGEVTDPDIDIFDREQAFIDRYLLGITQRLPQLKVVLEHITTEHGVNFVRDSGPQVAASITAHHLLYNRNHMLAGGIRPHYYCLPILKREKHRQALLAAATSAEPKFFLGTDSAPHAQGRKESSCGCAGSYTAHAAIELYAEAFASIDALDKLEAFASLHGADYYGLPRNTRRITLQQQDWQVADHYPLGQNDRLVPLCAGETLHWKLV